MSEKTKIENTPENEARFLRDVRENTQNLMALRAKGYNVNVTLFRLPEEVGVQLVAQDSVSTQVSSNLAVPMKDLREKQLESAADEAAKHLQNRMQVHNERMRQNYVYPKGGFVRIEIVNPFNDAKVVGEGHVSIKEVFNRRQAGARASGKLFQRLLKASRFGGLKGEQKTKAISDLVADPVAEE